MSCPFHSDESDGEADDDEPAGAETPSEPDDDRGIERRELVKSALAIGGTSAIGTLGGIAGITPTARAAKRDGRVDAAARCNRQHAWDAFEATVATGNTAQPPYSLILGLQYEGPTDAPPDPGDRRQVEAALREIERHFAWGHEGILFTLGYSSRYFDRFDADPPAGADPTPPERVADYASDVTPYEPDPEHAEAALVLASDNPANVLAVEEALWGETVTVDDEEIDFEATFEGVFERPTEWPDRRIGFAGPELPEDRYEEEFEKESGEAIDIPDDAPLSMGFVAGFDASVPEEDAVTLEHGQRFPGPDIDADQVPDEPYVGEVGERDPGVFAQGTLKQLSYLEIDLGEWYDRERSNRRHQIYSPYHEADETTTNEEKPGSGLTQGDRGDGPGTDDLVARATDVGDGEDGDDGKDMDHGDGGDDVDHGDDGDVVYAERTPKTATEGTEATDETPTTGHSQKAARARYDIDGDGELEQPCLRRDWDGIRPAENGYEKAPGYHFNVPMRFNEGIFTLLDANYSPGFTSLDGRIDHEPVDEDSPTGLHGDRNGIVPFMEATRRGNFLVPPIRQRALPYPRAVEASIETIEQTDDEYVVTVTEAGKVDPQSIEFGAPETVNKARGVEPTKTSYRRNKAIFRFSADAVDSEDSEVKLYAERAQTRRPVTATARLDAE